MSADQRDEVFAEISRSGYYPEIVAQGLSDALADEVGARATSCTTNPPSIVTRSVGT